MVCRFEYFRSFCVELSIYLFFFFSSRRRHTRSLRDWSSDVCSSDLADLATAAQEAGAPAPVELGLVDVNSLPGSVGDAAFAAAADTITNPVQSPLGRSEERRVGKECRSRGSRDHQQKKKSKEGMNG